MDFKLENAVPVVASCVVLHNLCEKFGDNFRDEWNDTTVQSTHFSTNSIAQPNRNSYTWPLRSRMQLRTFHPVEQTHYNHWCVCMCVA